MIADRNEMLHILVAVDGSEHALAAVRWVAQMASNGAALRCTVLNVQKPILSGEVGVIAPASVALGERDRYAATILEHASAILGKSGVSFAAEEQLDDAATAILARAAALDCDAIAVGRRGQGVLRAALLGSVSAEVVRRSAIPVIVVNPLQSKRPAVPVRLLLAVDGSVSAMRAAGFAGRLITTCGGEVHLMHVTPGLTVAGLIFGSREKTIEQWSGKHAEEALADSRSLLIRLRVPYTEQLVVSDDPPTAILNTAQQHSCSMLALGTRGLGPVSGMLLGSVAQSILEQSATTVDAVLLAR